MGSSPHNFPLNWMYQYILMKKTVGGMIAELLEVERDEHLGYVKHDTASKETDNSRNGYSPKTVRSSQDNIGLKISRDGKGEFL